jgi:hypothetical protein
MMSGVDGESSAGGQMLCDNNLHNVELAAAPKRPEQKNYVRPCGKLWAHRRKVNTRSFSQKYMWIQSAASPASFD